MLTLSSHPDTFRWQDVRTAHSEIARYLGQQEVSPVGRSRSFDGAAWARRLRSVSVVDISYSGEVETTPRRSEAFILVQIALVGTAVIRSGLEQIRLLPGWATAVDLGKPTSVRFSTDHVSRIMRIERGALGAQLRDMLGHPLTEPLEFGLGMDAAGSRIFVEDAAILVQRLQADPETYTPESAAAVVEKNLMTRLLLSANHNHRSRLTGGPPLALTMVVRKSIDLMHSHPDWDHTLESLARNAGVSPRTLERAFQRDKATSPMAYLKAVRLDRARDDLRTAAAEVLSVGDVARRWGFVNRGRFAAEYRQRHGESPSATLRR